MQSLARKLDCVRDNEDCLQAENSRSFIKTAREDDGKERGREWVAGAGEHGMGKKMQSCSKAKEKLEGKVEYK